MVKREFNIAIYFLYQVDSPRAEREKKAYFVIVRSLEIALKNDIRLHQEEQREAWDRKVLSSLCHILDYVPSCRLQIHANAHIKTSDLHKTFATCTFIRGLSNT